MKLRYLLIGFALGLLVGWWWSVEDQEARAGERVSPNPNPVDRSTTRPTRSTNKQAKDALVDIEGIGPGYEKALNAIGISTFAQLADQNADELAEKLPARVTAERIRRERWIEQAKSLAK